MVKTGRTTLLELPRKTKITNLIHPMTGVSLPLLLDAYSALAISECVAWSFRKLNVSFYNYYIQEEHAGEESGGEERLNYDEFIISRR